LSGCWTRCCPGRLVYGPSAWRRTCPGGPAGSRCVPRNPCVRQSGSGTASRYSWRTPARALCWWRACSAGPGTAGTCCLSAWGTGWA
ncbi:putative transcriptional regulator, partial [Dysosmobacter welbionis]